MQLALAYPSKTPRMTNHEQRLLYDFTFNCDDMYNMFYCRWLRKEVALLTHALAPTKDMNPQETAS